MAIVFHPKFPTPDRTKQSVRLSKDEDGITDLGWCDGVLSDGRAFRAEFWAQDQISMLTFFFSTIELENFDAAAMRQLVDRERLASFKAGSSGHCQAVKVDDDRGNPIWSVNVMVGDDENSYLDGSVPLFPYSRIGETNTMFNPAPIKAAGRLADD